MGLDVYLRKCADLEAARKAEEAAEQEIEALWRKVGGYTAATERQKEEIAIKSDEISKKYGLKGRYSRHSSIVEMGDVDSKTDSEHLFKIGYFRSSYNEIGIESVLGNLDLPTLHDIFQPGEEYEFKPDWNAALAKVNQAIQGYEQHLNGGLGKFKITKISPLWDEGVSNEKQALELFGQQLEKSNQQSEKHNWSTKDGGFFFSGHLKVHAIITKTFNPSDANDLVGRIINRPSVFVVYEKESEDKEDWYLTALKIVRESIEYVLSQPDKDDFFLTWSA